MAVVRGATSRRRCDEWIFRRWMAVRARWAFQLSRIELPRKLSVATLSRVWSRRSTPTPMATGPKHQLPIDAVEIGFYVEIEHPVVPPTALTSLAHGIDRRFAGPVAIESAWNASSKRGSR